MKFRIPFCEPMNVRGLLDKTDRESNSVHGNPRFLAY